jgi:hypothetical protein
MGAAAGVAFSVLVMLAERRRSFADLRTARFAAWGFMAGAGSFMLASSALAVRSHTPIDANLLVWSAIYGAVGASLGALIYRVARRTPVALDVRVHAAKNAPVIERTLHPTTEAVQIPTRSNRSISGFTLTVFSSVWPRQPPSTKRCA